MSVLEAKNITYKYGVGTPFEVTALDGVDFKTKDGSLTALIGQTGSGKSTLIQHFNALLQPHSGVVTLDGRDINADKKSIRQARFEVGMCFQYPEYQLFESTVALDIAFGPKNMGLSKEEISERVARAAEFTRLTKAMLDRSPFELSGGEKRRAAIAGVIAMEPKILVMDEPAAGLDPAGRREIFSLIENYRKNTGSTVIIVSHSMEDVAEYAEDVYVMSHGKIVMNGAPSEVFSKYDEIRALRLDVPQMTGVFHRLRLDGFDVPDDVYTVEQARDAILTALGKAGGNRC